MIRHSFRQIAALSAILSSVVMFYAMNLITRVPVSPAKRSALSPITQIHLNSQLPKTSDGISSVMFSCESEGKQCLLTQYQSIPDKIDINSAPPVLLSILPGIGSTQAQNIVAYREKHGKFKSPEELIRVPGITRTKLESIRDLICVTASGY